ncbi:MAG: sigma-70 family RNA polymerase sigma factor [Planctomycetota bacterium]
MDVTRWTLIEAAKRGEPVAFEALVGRYRPPVVSYLRRFGFGAADAEDLAQEVFVRLYQRVLPVADPDRGRFRGLLLSTTKHLALEHLRAQRAQKRGGDHVRRDLEQAPEPATPADDAFDREWLGHLLERSLERLEREHPSYHAALSASLLDGLSYKEAAERLGIGVSDVGNHIHRGRKKVSGYLREEVGFYAGSPQEHRTEVALLQRLLEPPAP